MSLSRNTAGIGDSFKRQKVFNYLKKIAHLKAVIFLQETHNVKRKKKYGITSGDVEKILCFAHGTSNSRDALMAFREGLNYKVIFSHLNDNGRYVIFKVEIQILPIILINYYAPNEEGQQVQILTEISEILEKMELEEDSQLIWGGDLTPLIVN